MKYPKILPDTRWWIYLLVDPRVTSGRAQDEVRYVGFSTDCDSRLDVHLDEAAKSTRNTHKLNWIRSLLRDNLVPLVRVVDKGFGDSWESAERHWVAFYRHEVGANLTNATDGGDGVPGYRHTDETKKYIGVTSSARKHRDSSKKLMSIKRRTRTGFTIPDVVRSRMSESNKIAWELRRSRDQQFGTAQQRNEVGQYVKDNPCW